MKNLWAPWRQEYIQSEKKGCIFCVAVKEAQEAKSLVVHLGKECLVMLNKYPYNYGHLMIAPIRHKRDLLELTQEEVQEMMKLLGEAQALLKKELKPEGFNIGMNIGKAAGAGEEHLHFHIVPRWVGDTNFMPVASETKVISQHLSELLGRLRGSFRGT